MDKIELPKDENAEEGEGDDEPKYELKLNTKIIP